MAAAPGSIRVAIIGGGLAGTLIMNALIRHPQFDVNLYEAKSAIQERGASVGLSGNAQRALRLLGPPFSEVTKKAQAVKVGCLQLIVVCEQDFFECGESEPTNSGLPWHKHAAHLF